MVKLCEFTKRQLVTLAVFSVADFFNAICFSLQAPFFPNEAESKGASATEYGFVFGIYELVVFLSSPIYGQYMKKIGPKRLFNGGILVSSISLIAFGFLDLVDGHLEFITLAFIVRIIEALGNAAFLTASFAIIANEFPDNVATTFASLETFFGFGLIAGPSLGGVLYELGGFTLPFVIMGTMLFITAFTTAFILPNHISDVGDKTNTGRLQEVLKIPGIPLCALTILTTSMSITFLQTTLEPHLREFDLSPILVGLVFVINGSAYAFSTAWWGVICDRVANPKTVKVIGCIVLLIGVSLIGPAPFLPFGTNMTAIILGLVFHGVGVGARLVSSFADALKIAVARGLHNNLETYGLVSGLWTSSFALGAFIGPTVSGFLYDSMGFPNASMFLIFLLVLMGIVEIISLYNLKRNQWKMRKMAVEVDTSGNNNYTIVTTLSNERLLNNSHKNNCIYKNNSFNPYNNDNMRYNHADDEMTPLIHTRA